MLHDLTWDNYLELTKFIDQQTYKLEYCSPISLVTFINYEIRHKYRILPTKEILLYVCYETSTPDVLDRWALSTCYYFDNSSIDELKNQIEIDLKQLNPNKTEIDCAAISLNMLDDFNLRNFNIVTNDYISNYIYDLEKMKTFAGKKLQKKRNHLNAFYYANYNITIKDIRTVNFDDIMVYLDYHMHKYADSFRQYEYAIYQELLHNDMSIDANFFGTVIYIDDRIVAVTLCYLHKNICEVILEKAERDIRGLYQYLIKTNLLTHNVSVAYMDRQDDGGITELAQSKKSYYPEVMVQRFDVLGIKKW